jgi:hypothetical protein
MQMEMKLASESHIPRFRAGVGTWRSGYMIPIRLPWRHRARPSATLHEIPVCPERQTYPYDATQAGGIRQEGTPAGRVLNSAFLSVGTLPSGLASETGFPGARTLRAWG